jgi:hypothetical protein
VVLDNSSSPIPEVTLRLFRTHHGTGVAEQVVTPVQTDAQGHFLIQPAPVGAFKLMADGSTAPNGPWPTLEFDLVTVAGRANDVGLPIYLPQLDADNRLCVTETTGGTLTLPQVPGFALTIAPGAATFPGGARSGCISVTPVNGDKVPMSPGFGQQPRFVVTIQPVGTIFNPPAQITLPNVDGLGPRQVTEMYSYDHDLAAFVSIGTGTVSEDGSVISSDPGVGVIKAGWHCGGNPNPVGSVGTCPACQRCQGTSCVVDNSMTCDDGKFCTQNDKCSAGACTGTPIPDHTNATTTIAVNFDKAFDPVKNFLKTVFGSGAPEFNLQLAGGSGSVDQCCETTRSTVTNKTGQLAGTGGIQGEFPIPGFSLPLGRFGNAGLFGTIALSASATVSATDNVCTNTITGTATGQLQLTGGVKGQITFPAEVAAASIGGTIGATCGLVGQVERGQISGTATCGHNGLLVTATVQLINGLIEISETWTFIEPSTPTPVPITVPFTL